MTLLFTEPVLKFKEAMIALSCWWTFAIWDCSFHEHYVDFKWRLLWQHITHGVDGHEVSLNQEDNSNFTMNLLTLGPKPAFAIRKISLHSMRCTSSPPQHTWVSAEHLLCRTPCTETSTNMLAALRQPTKHTRLVWCMKWPYVTWSRQVVI